MRELGEKIKPKSQIKKPLRGRNAHEKAEWGLKNIFFPKWLPHYRIRTNAFNLYIDFFKYNNREQIV